MTTDTAAPTILQAERELWPIERLIPYTRNSKRHPPEQIAELKSLIQTFGFTIPVLVDEANVVIAGHGRIMAAKELGMTALPVIVARGWTDAMRRAYTIADNRIAEKGQIDEAVLASELATLKAEDFDIGVVGYSGAELDTILSGWASDLSSVERHGSHTDGITTTIKVQVAQEHSAAATAAIKDALTAANIGFEL